MCFGPSNLDLYRYLQILCKASAYVLNMHRRAIPNKIDITMAKYSDDG
jgi:hypothetical protein